MVQADRTLRHKGLTEIAMASLIACRHQRLCDSQHFTRLIAFVSVLRDRAQRVPLHSYLVVGKGRCKFEAVLAHKVPSAKISDSGRTTVLCGCPP